MLNEHEIRALVVWYENSDSDALKPVLFTDINNPIHVMAADPCILDDIRDEKSGNV